MDGAIVGSIIGILIATALNTLIIWIAAKIGIGIEIDSFGNVILTALLVAILGVVLSKLTHNWGGMFGGEGGSTILHVIGTAIILLIVDKILPGMRTKGIFGAILAAVVIGVVYWLVNMLLSGVMK